MKTRSGFVSNSSSSSFVAIGFDITKLDNKEEILDKVDKVSWKDDVRSFDGPEDGVTKKSTYVGKLLADHIEDYEGENITLTPSKLDKEAEELREKLGLPDDMNWILFVGCRSC